MSPLRRLRVPFSVVLGALLLPACGNDAPAPGEQLEVDGESPLVTDPGGVANQLTNDEIQDEDGLRD